MLTHSESAHAEPLNRIHAFDFMTNLTLFYIGKYLILLMQTSDLGCDYIKPFFKRFCFRISANWMVNILSFVYAIMGSALCICQEHRIRNWIQLGLQTRSETLSFLQCRLKTLIGKYLGKYFYKKRSNWM